MLKALIKKQFRELNAFYFQDRKTGKMRTGWKAGLFIGLFVFLFLLLGVSLGFLMYLLTPILSTPYAWLYYALVGIAALVFGVFGSAFNTYASMYHAKDNDLLLSMPIPPAYILAVRIGGVALMTLLYENLVWIPALIVAWIFGAPSVLSVLFGILLIPVITLFATVFACLLGFVVAVISARLKNKSLIVVILSLALIGGYYYLSAQASELISSLVTNGEAVAANVKKWIYIFYQLGNAATGDPLPMLLMTLEVAAMFALLCFILSKTFLRITTIRAGVAPRKTRAVTEAKSSSVGMALFRREWKRYLSSPTYILNCSLGTVFLVAVGIFMLVKREMILVLLSIFPIEGLGTVIAVAAVSLPSSMNIISAPSVSLEGKNLWIIRSLPVDSSKVLIAKQRLHYLLTIPPVIFAAISAGIATDSGFSGTVYLAVISCEMVALISAIGLVFGLRHPNFNWTNEAVPIKQSLAVLITMFGGWAISIVLGVGGYFALKVMSAEYVLLITIAILAVTVELINRWIRTRGARIFESF